MNFEFATAARILFGPGTRRQAVPAAASMGRSALVVTGADASRADWLIDELRAASMQSALLSVPGEPTVDLAAQGVAAAHEAAADVIVALGGGAAIDAAKAIAALVANGGEPLDYLEVIGRGNRLTAPSLPVIALPTTAGTGAEVTRNAVLASPQHRVKVSLRSPHMLPQLAIVDPELTLSMPPEVTASTGLDALTQCLEPYVSLQANPLTDALCREGMRRAAGSLRRAYHAGNDVTARKEMCLASLLGGLALANAKLGAVHGFASVIGGMFPAPHGVICARLLPLVMRANVDALRERAADSPVLDRYREIAALLTDDSKATLEDGVAWLDAIVRDLNIPGLGAYGLNPGEFGDIVAKTQRASSTKGNPIELTADELTAILRQAA